MRTLCALHDTHAALRPFHVPSRHLVLLEPSLAPERILAQFSPVKKNFTFFLRFIAGLSTSPRLARRGAQPQHKTPMKTLTHWTSPGYTHLRNEQASYAFRATSKEQLEALAAELEDQAKRKLRQVTMIEAYLNGETQASPDALHA